MAVQFAQPYRFTEQQLACMADAGILPRIGTDLIDGVPYRCGARVRHSGEDYERLSAIGVLGPDERVEFINGEVIAMSLVGGEHSTCVFDLDDFLSAAVGPEIRVAMNTNWYGLKGEDAQDLFEFLDDSELLGGIVGSKADHHAAPYSLTEEFVSVYRMHPLIPDEVVFRSHADDATLETIDLPDMAGRKTPAVCNRLSMTDLFYSFGRVHPGAITLHNYPRHLQNLTRDDGEHLDLAAVDILRDRERGVPRYNEFRRHFHKDPVASFEELTENREWREEIRRVYNNDLDKVDLMTGLYAEPLPEGFGFSETAFRVFVLMASRRLKSDRFFTDDYRAEVYTELGIHYLRQTTMLDLLKRHYPDLRPALDGVDNAFKPWRAAAP